MTGLVSIIIPIYNSEKYLDRCLTSLVNQTYEDIEIILVDDGSTDTSPAICDAWALRDDRIKVVHKQNAGAGMARNTGLENATGRFVTFVDSDDHIDLDTVKRCALEYDKNHSDVIMFGRNNVTPDGRVERFPIFSEKECFQGEEIFEDVLPGLFTYKRGVGIGVCGKFFNHDLIKSNGVTFRSEREVLSEDALFILETFSHVNTVSVLTENFYYYCQNGNSLSRAYKLGHYERCDTFFLESKRLCERKKYPARVMEHVCLRYRIYMLSGMRRLMASDMPSAEKRTEFLRFFGDDLLKETLVKDSLRKEPASMRFFWKCFALGLRPICYALLWMKSR